MSTHPHLRRRVRARLVALAAALTLGGGLSACSTAPALSLTSGDCFSLPETSDTLTLTTLPCETAHDAEVIAVIALDKAEPTFGSDKAAAQPNTIGAHPAGGAGAGGADGHPPQAAPLIPHNAAPPADHVVNTLGTRLCDAAFAAYVGVPPEDSSLNVAWYKPTEASWAKGDRSLTCFVHTAGGTPLTSSVKDSKR